MIYDLSKIYNYVIEIGVKKKIDKGKYKFKKSIIEFIIIGEIQLKIRIKEIRNKKRQIIIKIQYLKINKLKSIKK